MEKTEGKAVKIGANHICYDDGGFFSNPLINIAEKCVITGER
jgi:hypothetical protein